VAPPVRESRSGQHVWRTKPVLRAVYTHYYGEIAARCRAGPTLEVGGGSGNLKSYVVDAITSDIQHVPWLDVVADAHFLPFAAGSLGNVVLFDVLHHLQRPRLFLLEAERVLRPGGRLLMVEPAITPLSWLLYKLLHDEPVRMSDDPLAEGGIDPTRDPFASNQAIPTLLFGRYRHRLAHAFPRLRLIEKRRIAYFAYPLSGGFKRWSLLPIWAVGPLLRLEQWLEPVLQSIMAFRLLVVMEKRFDVVHKRYDMTRFRDTSHVYK
jgi:SAM-dependent methyltransferase